MDNLAVVIRMERSAPLRLPLTSQTRQSHVRLAGVAGLLCVLLVAGGCKNGFLDPTEMGGFHKRALLVKILPRLDTQFEEPNVEFANATAVRPEDLVAQSGDYSLGPNDLVSVTITDLVAPQVQSTETKRVSESGTVSLPLVGPVRATGLTEAQFETAVQQVYADRGLIRNAQVSVTVIEARNRTYSVYGSVGRPGQYAINQSDFRLTDAVLQAGDVTNINIDYVYVIRKLKHEPGADGAAAPGAPTTRPNQDILVPRSRADEAADADRAALARLMTEGQDPPAVTDPGTRPADMEGRVITVEGQPVPADPSAPAQPPATDAAAADAPDAAFEFQPPPEPTDIRVIRVPWEELRNQGARKYNIVIRPHDEIFIPLPQIGVYYMGGHIARTGVYSLSGNKVTLKQAVIAAGMLDQLAIPQRTQVVRRLPGRNEEVFATVDLAKIFAGEAPDFYLKGDDQIMVGTSPLAPFIAAVRNGFRVTYGFGFLYDRNYAPVETN
jgi:protein involved in polysaccharide export with SLBB domain